MRGENQRRQRSLVEIEGVHEIVRLAVLRGRIQRRERGGAEDGLDELRDGGLLGDLFEDEARLRVGGDDDEREAEAQAVRRGGVAAVLTRRGNVVGPAAEVV